MKFQEHLRNNRELIAILILQDKIWRDVNEAADWLHVVYPNKSLRSCRKLAKYCLKNGFIKESRYLEMGILNLWSLHVKTEPPLLKLVGLNNINKNFTYEFIRSR